MEVMGPCAVCRRHARLFGCTICGMQVCGEHYRHAERVCIPCARRAAPGGHGHHLGDAGPDRPPQPGDAGDRFT